MNLPRSDRALIVFARTPRQGQVKTRLIPALGAGGALALYERLLVHTLQTVRDSELAQPRLYCTPDPQHAFFRRQAGDFICCRQQGRDLGERMHRALADTLQMARAAVLIGCDCPAIDADYLTQAFTALAGHDVVLGPATDGGYVLIGVKQARAALFQDIDWGTGRVLAQTRQALQGLGLSWHELATLPDIDTPADLRFLPGSLHAGAGMDKLR